MHLERNKFDAMAGPDGGNGGRGGHIKLRGNSQLWTLLHMRYYKNVLAKDGENGYKNNSTGHDGADIVLEVPLGTIAKDSETGEVEVEILHDGQEVIWIKGGRGGLGNANFATPTNQTPDYAQPGEMGHEGIKILELKILADVGLVGFPQQRLLGADHARGPAIVAVRTGLIVQHPDPDRGGLRACHGGQQQRGGSRKGGSASQQHEFPGPSKDNGAGPQGPTPFV